MDIAGLQALQALAQHRLAPIGHLSGRILYSASTTLKPGPIYLVGLNPGGLPSAHADTVNDAIEEFGSRTTNAYLEECWKRRSPGESPIQRRVRWLVEGLGQDVADVCASNLIFIRSRSAANCRYPELADLCWPVHQAILEIVKPRLLLVFGNSGISPFRYLRDRFKPQTVDSIAAGHGTWRCLAFRGPDGLAVIGVPHLSRYAIDRHPAVAAWIGAYADLEPEALGHVGEMLKMEKLRHRKKGVY